MAHVWTSRRIPTLANKHLKSTKTSSIIDFGGLKDEIENNTSTWRPLYLIHNGQVELTAQHNHRANEYIGSYRLLGTIVTTERES